MRAYNMETLYKFHYTNTCTCDYHDDITGEITPSDNCWGSCWEFVLEDFMEITNHLFIKNETNWWRISNIKLWNREVSGFVHARGVLDLIRGMTVNSEWKMTGEIYEDRIEYSLSHHDAPMGSSSCVTIVSEEEREKLGLY